MVKVKEKTTVGGVQLKVISENEISINGTSYILKESLSKPGRYVIVRTYSAGVFAGNLESRNGQEVVLANARRIWYWDGAASLSQLAVEGTSKPENCKFPCEVARVELLQAIEILNTTKQAEESIKGVPIWKK